jgi:hypothetical protein
MDSVGKNHLSDTNRRAVCTKAPTFISRYYPADEVTFGPYRSAGRGLIECKKVLSCVFLLNLAGTYADKIPIELCIFR